MRGPPPQSSTLFHRLHLRPTASCSNPHFPLGHKSPWDEGQVQLMPPPCQESAGNAKQLVKRLVTRNFTTQGKCARKKAMRQSALASSYDEPFCRRVLQCYAHTLAPTFCTVTESALLSCEKISATGLTSTLCPCYFAKEFGRRKTLREPVC